MLSFNNHFFTLSKNFSKSFSQIKNLKNREDILTSINSTTNVNSIVKPNIEIVADKNIFIKFNNKYLATSKVKNLISENYRSTLHSNTDLIAIGKILRKNKKIAKNKRTPLKLAVSKNLTLINFFNSLNNNLLDPLNKKKITYLLQPFFINENNKNLTKFSPLNFKLFNNLGAAADINKINKDNNSNNLFLIKNNHIRFETNDAFNLNFYNDYRHNYYNIRNVDNKRLLFLYFILPIFFATLKNSISKPLIRNEFLRNGAANQLRSLIKLIFISGSTLKKIKTRNINSSLNKTRLSTSQLLSHSHKIIKYNKFTSLLAYKSNYRKLLNVNNLVNVKQINNYNNNNLYSEVFLKNINKKNKLSHISTSVDLFKWAILFLVQSLAPLKRKDNFHSLIFFKILEAKNLLKVNTLNNNVNYNTPNNKGGRNYPIIKDIYKKDKSIFTDLKDPALLNISNYKAKPIEISKSSKFNNIDIEASNFREKKIKQNRLVTYFPGGRLIRD
jgi:hypothetical protein